MLQINDYQREVDRTTVMAPAEGRWFSQEEIGLIASAIGMAGEVGEFVEPIKKFLFHGHNLDTDKLVLELGDVLWYVTLASNVLGIPLHEVMNKNIEKLRRRYPDGFSIEDSLNREEYRNVSDRHGVLPSGPYGPRPTDPRRIPCS
jgi:NTP pyrophosphatase (non-canonical NTP hydrolase)